MANFQGYVLLSFLVGAPGLQSQTIQVRPRNSAVLADSQVTLSCGFSTTPTPLVKWREYISNPSVGYIISSGGTINPSHPKGARYSITNLTAGQYNLQVSPFTADDAGYYSCSGNPFENPKYGAYVMYLGKVTCGATQNGENISTVREGQAFTLQCKREYKSFPGWPPILDWIGETQIRNITTPTEVRYEVDVIAVESTDGITYKCATSFTDPPPFRPANGNTQDDSRRPLFSEADCETRVQVHWPAKNIIRQPEQTVYYPGENVICAASANPPANFTWIKLQGNGPNERRSAVLPITEEMIGESVYQCLATSFIKGNDVIRGRNFTFRVVSKNTSEDVRFWMSPNRTVNYVHVGENITCHTSTSLPSPAYRWIKISGPGPDLICSQHMRAMADMKNQLVSYVCEVTYVHQMEVLRRSQRFTFIVLDKSV